MTTHLQHTVEAVAGNPKWILVAETPNSRSNEVTQSRIASYS